MSRECRQSGRPETAEDAKDAAGGHHHQGKSSEQLLDKTVILDHLGIVPGQTVLDAGCGSGYMAKEFSRRVGDAGKVFALDRDEIAVATLREETAGTNVSALVGDITTGMPLPPSSLDLVYVSMVLHGFSPAQIKGFRVEVVRLLKPQGRLAIVEIAKRDTPFGPPLRIRFSPEELKRALRLVPQATVDVGEHCYMQLFEKEEEER